ncbi:MAG: hypothetical protein LBR72_02850 [Oscillospiraceae bacterium]|jgi:hypothetical protein|nr:hypothetical protein [Oscillospiraceae bacterium]
MGAAEIYDAVVTRLGMLSYAVTDDDGAAIRYAIDRAEERLKDSINQPEVPYGLRFVWADMAAGLLLSDKKTAGTLTGAAFEFSAPVESVKAGDTTTSFAVSTAQTPEARFDRMISGMINPPAEQLARYRRVCW